MRSALLALVPIVAAWPAVLEMMDAQSKGMPLVKRADPDPGVQAPKRKPLFLSKRPNTGASYPIPAPFDQKAQYVNVEPHTQHEFQAPKTTDLRGQCPGLNAAANHGFLPRTGKPTIADTITGLGEAYNMSPDLALFLAVVSVALAGDPVTQTWSIGGAFPNTLPFPASGIVGTHNQYEGDASIMRGDAYLNDGKVYVFENHKWRNFVNMGDSYTLDNAAAQIDYVSRYSEYNNPYYFSAPFAGFVTPAAHDFVINFMSNHSAENPGGYLNYEILSEFFAVTGDKKNFVHHPGQERIPLNWYKRPGSQKYDIPDVFTDLFTNNAMYPGQIRIGGNTGKTNSFVGVKVGDLSGNQYSSIADLAKGNNAFCFLIQAFSAGLADGTDPVVSLGVTLLDWVTSQFAPLKSRFSCPELKKINSTPIFKQFPGASYKSSGVYKK